MNLPPDLPAPHSADTNAWAPPQSLFPDPDAPAATAALFEFNQAPRTEHQAAPLAAIHRAVSQVFLGQEEVIHQVLAALLAGGHVLLEGKPGLGKTHLVLALARTFGGAFRRIQFTPDLMPSDVTGHTLFDLAAQQFRVRQGPVFTQLLLADEINRAPAKTQSALLEVMQEGQVTIDGETHTLTLPHS
jgi:MoxR-like ATPase